MQENSVKNGKVSKNIWLCIYKCQKFKNFVKKQQIILATVELLNPKKKFYC